MTIQFWRAVRARHLIDNGPIFRLLRIIGDYGIPSVSKDGEISHNCTMTLQK